VRAHSARSTPSGEQRAPRKLGERLAEHALEPDPERDDAGGAVAEPFELRSGRPSANPSQSSCGYISSSLPGELSSQSLQSRHELIVSSSRRVTGGAGSPSSSSRRMSTPATMPRSIAIPSSIPATVFVHERVFRNVSASPSAYSSTTTSPSRETTTLVICP
jgi:hypothetical protein